MLKPSHPRAGLAASMLVTALPVAAAAPQSPAPVMEAVDDAEAARLAERVRAEFLHAWSGYRQYAWGHDELRPLSRTPRDWYRQSLLMTPVEALDTMILMGVAPPATLDPQQVVLSTEAHPLRRTWPAK
jgi:mannosidase alpha-like ER degradation enhancer 2